MSFVYNVYVILQISKQEKKAQSGQINQASGEANEDNMIYLNDSRVLTSLPAIVVALSHATLLFKTSTITHYKSYNTD